MEHLNELDPSVIQKICFERGINTEQSLKHQIEDLKLWLSISNLRNVPHSLLLVTRVNDFSSDQFEIDDNETQDEILRRVSTIVIPLVKIRSLLFRVSQGVRASVRNQTT